MSILQVPGAELHYDLVGDGPPIVFIPGAQGSAMVFQPIAQALKERFTALTYDRRGFSRSSLDGEQDYTRRLETDADDVARLIEHLGRGPAHVFGSSSGAVVALTVLARHPEAVRTLIAHEPPALRFLPNAEDMIREDEAIYDLYRADGIGAGMARFMKAWMPSPTSDQALFSQFGSAIPEPIAKNMSYWFEHELRQYPPTEFDMAALRRSADRLIFVMGEEMRANPKTPIIEALSAELRAPLHTLPGGHIGYAVKAAAFAEQLTGLLSEAPAPAGA